jgi:sec-independent protein translocase protein TatB
MFDIGWSELVVVGVVALVVIGPKDMPAALRTLGKAMGTMRRMAGEFQSQFNEAMREAELDQLRKDVEDIRRQAEQAVAIPDLSSIAQNEIKGAIETAPAAAAALPAPDAAPVAEAGPPPEGPADPLAVQFTPGLEPWATTPEPAVDLPPPAVAASEPLPILPEPPTTAADTPAEPKPPGRAEGAA